MLRNYGNVINGIISPQTIKTCLTIDGSDLLFIDLVVIMRERRVSRNDTHRTTFRLSWVVTFYLITKSMGNIIVENVHIPALPHRLMIIRVICYKDTLV